MMHDGTLVSVIVISYQSADFIRETLESVYAQSYSPIELIVADDCSADRTAEIAQEWVAEKGGRFQSCIVRVNPANLGIPGNLNTAIKLAKGEFIKVIAADDLLLPDCIAVNVRECQEKGYDHLCTWLIKFTDTENGRREWTEQPSVPFFQGDARTQSRMLLRKNYVYGSIFFFRKSYLVNLGLYDERYRMLEDYPMWIKITSRGDRLHFLNHPTVAYRISQSSISNGSGQRVVNINYFRCYRRFFYDEIFPRLIHSGMIAALFLHWRDFLYRWVMIGLGNDRGSKAVRFVEYFHKRMYLPGRRQNG